MSGRRFGRIIFIGPDTLLSPPRCPFLPYDATKGAMLGVVRTPAVALDADGIAVTAVAPVLTDAPASRAVNQDGQFEAVVARKAMKRSLGPEDTAHTRGLPCLRR